jgi:hypothetical protein
MTKKLPGINIQWPWSEFILSKAKTVETRSYALPKKYENVEMALIETPGPEGKYNQIFSARIVGTVTFMGSFQYVSQQHWASDFRRHLIAADHRIFAFEGSRPKWGWEIKRIERFNSPVVAPRRKGIVFTLVCEI